ncbi:MAG TPA: cysteine--tRNA ligase [Butyricimonas virosa]|nr:cysteine--tRNA ligase [Butyricimonas virosa]HAP18373.1 cysteine--tRNA ligase [Butyricimonas virosa]
MENKLTIYNTLSRKKELFEPINPPFVGLYVCGPTVYGDAHLGHARPAITFDLLFRYLKFMGYRVRYVRNITDVGHLVNDADEGEDKIAKKAKLEQLEPMEVVQFYSNRYHKNMEQLNTLPPSIEPHASGHIIEQQELIKQIIENGFAYESEGNIYFDVERYNQKYHYGKLSGRKIDELFANTRELSGQQEKRNPFDFALWKKASPEHIMRWPSPWGVGFPGWHLECSCMSQKYLGETFDIHGGGLDLQFPHHECEIAQNVAAQGHEAVKYWMHNNMVTINGQKMGKSLGNFITLDQLFSGDNKVLEQAYSPMTIRFFILQAHYRSTVDFSNEALQASEKGLQRLIEAIEGLDKITPAATTSEGINVKELRAKCYEAMNDDLNTPIVIAQLFEGARIINNINAGNATISAEDLKDLKETFHLFCFDIMGLKEEKGSSDGREAAYGKVVDMLLEQRMKAKANKDWATSDEIRNTLTALGFEVKDTKDGFEWRLNK